MNALHTRDGKYVGEIEEHGHSATVMISQDWPDGTREPVLALVLDPAATASLIAGLAESLAKSDLYDQLKTWLAEDWKETRRT